MVATNTINLQEQLLEKDIPCVRDLSFTGHQNSIHLQTSSVPCWLVEQIISVPTDLAVLYLAKLTSLKTDKEMSLREFLNGQMMDL